MKDKIVILSIIPVLLFASDLKGDIFRGIVSNENINENLAKNSELEKCLNSFSKNQFSKLLQNKTKDYLRISSRKGIKICSNANELRILERKKKLQKVTAKNGYTLDKFSFSYPYLVPYANNLLKEIGIRFTNEIDQTPLKGTRFIVTSLTRTKHSVKKLTKSNNTAIKKSPHLNGNSMDFSFSRFDIVKNSPITPCDTQFLQETLSKVLYELKIKKKCWVTYERYENCLHVVANKVNL